jgi:hypothetical protein
MPVSLLVQSLIAFNLACTGSSVSVHGGRIHGELRPMSVVFRIDLDANRFCSDVCAETQPIASVTYGDIVLQDEIEKVSGEVIYRTVSRESGRYYAQRKTGVGRKLKRVVMVGNCERAPFTGFPERKF